MKPTLARIAAIFCFSLFVLAAGSAAAQEQQAAPSPAFAPFAGATISDWKGEIQLNLPGQSLSAPARGEILPAGTLLQTGRGRLLLRLSDGSQILIGAHTRLLVQQPAPSDHNYFQILFGRIRAFVSKQTGGAAPFQLGTPSAVIAVRGTEFEIEVNRLNVTEVDVIEGLLEVSGRTAAGRSVLLQPGFSTRVGIDGFPEEPTPTNEIRPEIERPQPGERELRDVKDLNEISQRHGIERELEIDLEIEHELDSEISDMLERKDVSEKPEVEVEIPKTL